MRSIVLLLVVMFCLNGCMFEERSSTELGESYQNGQGYGGGDPIYRALDGARNRLVDAAKRISNGEDLNSLCRSNGCNTGNAFSHCDALDSIADVPEKVQMCQLFIKVTFNTFLNLNGDITELFGVTSQTLTVEGASGESIEVAAKTVLEQNSKIVFNHDKTMALGSQELVALMAHELGHQAVFNDAHIDDNQPRSPFSSGREFLDIVAVAYTVYATDHRGNAGSLDTTFNKQGHFSTIIESDGHLDRAMFLADGRLFHQWREDPFEGFPFPLSNTELPFPELPPVDFPGLPPEPTVDLPSFSMGLISSRGPALNTEIELGFDGDLLDIRFVEPNPQGGQLVLIEKEIWIEELSLRSSEVWRVSSEGELGSEPITVLAHPETSYHQLKAFPDESFLAFSEVGEGGYTIQRFLKSGEIDTAFGENGELFVNQEAFVRHVYRVPSGDFTIVSELFPEFILPGFDDVDDFRPEVCIQKFQADGQTKLINEMERICLKPDDTQSPDLLPFISNWVSFTEVVEDGVVLAIGNELRKYNFDGTLATDFGQSGVASLGVKINSKTAIRHAMLNDGKILIIATTSLHDLSLIRFNADGSPDSSFGVDGKATHKLVTGAEELLDIYVQWQKVRVALHGYDESDNEIITFYEFHNY